jgi:hypothetical protein
MLWGFILFIVWTALEIVVVIGTIMWSVGNGDWKNIEEPKYAVLQDRELADWPGRQPWAKREPPKPRLKQQAAKPVKG